MHFDSTLDLQQLRDIDLPLADVRRAWTDPEVLKQKYPKGFTAARPYLRVTPQPNK